MSKKHHKPQQEQPATAPEAQPQQQPAPAPEAARPPVSKGMIWTFWGGVAAAVIAARVLDATLTTVPDRVLERWVMLAFAAFVGVFLYKLK